MRRRIFDVDVREIMWSLLPAALATKTRCQCHPWGGCKDRAKDRLGLCLKGLPEPPPWSPRDEEVWRNPLR